jgi:Fic family protein
MPYYGKSKEDYLMRAIIAPTRMEPVRIEEATPALMRRVDDLCELSSQLSQLNALADDPELRRTMAVANAWHSSRIEKRVCDPMQALAILGGEETSDAVATEVACLAMLHEKVREEVRSGTSQDISSMDWIIEKHKQFASGASGLKVGLRSVDVVVGRHVPPPYDHLQEFMRHFSHRFRSDRLNGRATPVLAWATAHHRLSWIHPFEDGNGRVARLYSYAFAEQIGMAPGSLWSLSRALAEGVPGRPDYHEMMAVADRPRQGDRDGRGNLSLSALIGFADWFLEAVGLEMKRSWDDLKEVPAVRGLSTQEWAQSLPLLFKVEA